MTRAYGNIHKFHFNYEDCHPPKGYVNWWEDEKSIKKKAERQQIRKDEKNRVNEYMKGEANEL